MAYLSTEREGRWGTAPEARVISLAAMSPRTRRPTKTLEFMPPDVSEVAHALAGLRQAGSGWINLLPGVDDEAAPEPGAGLFAFFGGGVPAVSMATVMPPGIERRTAEGPTVGLMHPAGAKAVPRLVEAGVSVPEGWVVVQDHPRRGLLVRTPVSVVEADIITWSVGAGIALCRAETTGRWRAVVYLPSAR